MIANHTSHLDALLLAAALPCRLCDCVFPVAAGDVFFNTPATSLFSATLLNALPMWRKNCGPHALADLKKRLIEEPCGLICFLKEHAVAMARSGRSSRGWACSRPARPFLSSPVN